MSPRPSGPFGPHPPGPRPGGDNTDELRRRIRDLERDLDRERERRDDDQDEIQRLTGYATYGRVLHALLVQAGVTPPPEPTGFLD